MANHTDKVTPVAIFIKDLLIANRTSLGLRDVLFGDQNMIPETPFAVVNCGPKRRQLAGVSAPGGRTMNSLTVFIDIHSSAVGSEADERLKLDQLADLIETKIHADPTCGGIIIHGFVTDWDPGQFFIGNSMFRTVRMTFVGETKTYLST